MGALLARLTGRGGGQGGQGGQGGSEQASPGARTMSVEELAEALRGRRRVAVLTGAGVSQESGVPTFRDPLDGLWSRHDMELCASADGFRDSPHSLWGLVADVHRRIGAKPNPAHRALARLQELGRLGPALITQNVDGLHQQAGSSGVIEYHGSLDRARCVRCGRVGPMAAALEPLLRDEAPPKAPPACAESGCGGHLRPDAVLYGERVPGAAVREAAEAVRLSDALLVVGTSAQVYPAAGLAEAARERGTPVYEVNLERTRLSAAGGPRDGVVLGRAGETLPRLLELFGHAGAAATTGGAPRGP